ncbi:metallophosphoesterase family protein [Desulfovibrio sp.]
MRPSALFRSLSAFLLLLLLLLTANPSLALRFAVISDTQGLDTRHVVNTQVLREVQDRILELSPRPSFVVVTGDLAIVGGEPDGRTHFADWTQAMRPLAEAGIAVWPVVGNHDLYVNGIHGMQYRWLQDAFIKAFPDVPRNGPEDYEGLAYSFEDRDSGSFFAVIDTYHIPKAMEDIVYTRRGHLRDEQLNWLDEKLAETKAKHRFVFGHNPVFSPLDHEQACAGNWCDLWKIMSRGGARVYFCGHDHLYSRKVIEAGTHPSAESGMLQVITPTAGGKPTKIDKLTLDDSWHLWSGHGFVVVDVDGDTISVTAWGRGPHGWEHIDGFDIKSY